MSISPCLLCTTINHLNMVIDLSLFVAHFLKKGLNRDYLKSED